MKKYCVQLFIVACLACWSASGAEASHTKLDQLCKGKSFELRTVGDIFPLIEALKTEQGAKGCSEGARGSVLELEPIIRAENVCSVEVAERIGRYYEKHLSKKSKHYWTLSSTVREYYLAVGSEISRLCERTLIDRLDDMNGEGMSKEDAIIFRDFNMDSNNIARAVGGQEKAIQDLFVVTKMDGFVPHKQQNVLAPHKQQQQQQPQNAPVGEQTAIAVNGVAKEKIDRMRAICRKSLKPIYEKMFTPLIMLANIGFEYNSNPTLLEDRAKFRQDKLYQNWFSLIITCEATNDLDVIEAPESSSKIDGDALTILERDDVKQLERETGLELDGHSIEAEEAPDVVELSVRLEPSTDLATDELRKEVRGISRRRKAAKGERKKVLHKLSRHFEKILKSKNLKVGLNKHRGGQGADEEGELKINWKLRVAMLFTGALTLASLLTFPVVSVVGVAIIFCLAAAASEK